MKTEAVNPICEEPEEGHRVLLRPGVVLVSTTPFSILAGLSSGELKLNSFHYQALSSLIETLIFNQTVVAMAPFTVLDDWSYKEYEKVRELFRQLEDKGIIKQRSLGSGISRGGLRDEFMDMTFHFPRPDIEPYVANFLTATGAANDDPEQNEIYLNNDFLGFSHTFLGRDWTNSFASASTHRMSLRMEDVMKRNERISLSALAYVLGESDDVIVKIWDALLKLLLSTGVQIYTDVVLTAVLALSLSPCSVYPPGIPRILYREMENKYRYYVDKLYNYTGSRRVFAPPLTAIVLDRCKDRMDIPEQIAKLKAELSEVSRTTDKFQKDLRRAKVFGDIVEVVNDFESGWAVLMNRIGRKGQRTSIIRKVWDVVKGVSPARMATEVLDQIYKADEESQLMLRVHTFYDLWRNLEKLPDEQSLIRKVFKDDVDFSDLPVNLRVARFADACHFGEHPGF